MNKEKIINLLIKNTLFEENTFDLHSQNEDPCLKLSVEEWQEIYQELSAQTIAGIPCEWMLDHAQLPDSVRNIWQESWSRQVVYFYRLLQVQSELCRLMKDNRIPLVILKGTAAAMYYPDPSARTMGDIDFLVSETDYRKACQLMREHGYQLLYEEDHVDYHMTLGKDHFVYELHRRPAGMPDGTEGDYLMALMRDGIRKAEYVDMDACLFPVLPALQNGLVLLLHIVKHLKNGLGLRQIIDWMMYVERELHDNNWYGGMQPVLEKAGLEALAISVTRMCQLYLGLGETGITWCTAAGDKVCQELMGYIMKQGNFGNKVKLEDKGARIVGEIRNPIHFFHLLQEKGQKKWKLVKRYPLLKHGAWIYMLCRYIEKSFQRKWPAKTILLDIKKGRQRRKLFDKLGIYQK